MPAIKKIITQGAGALGAMYAARFADAGGFEVYFLAGGERYERLKADGVLVNGRPYAIPVIHPRETTTPADLLIVALKHNHLHGAVADLAGVVGPETVVISVMNGVDSEAIIGEQVGIEKVLYCIAVGMDALREGNRVDYNNPGRLRFGEALNEDLSPRVARVAAALDAAGILHDTPLDMLRWLWWKFMVNVGVNQASAVMRVPYGVFQISPQAQALMEDLMREAVVLAQAEGIDLREADIQDWYPFLNALSPEGKTSMLQDIEAGRVTEVAAFGGKIVELGRKHHIPTPVNQAVVRIIRVLEGGNRG